VLVDGDIRINGHPLGNYMQKISGFMDQQDLFTESLTVREHLHFMVGMGYFVSLKCELEEKGRAKLA